MEKPLIISSEERTLNIEIFIIEDNISEKEFPEFIRKKGFKCIRLGLKQAGYKSDEKDKVLEKFYNDLAHSQYGSDFHLNLIGKPDFLIWNEKEYYYCEFKSANDILSHEQINWFFEYNKFPLSIAVVKGKNWQKAEEYDW